jgi:hypothetical protein
MGIFTRAAVMAASLFASGCAIHPLPEDVTGVPTYTIVRQIRCETRQAIIDSAVGWLTADGNEDRVDPASRAIGLEFANGRPIDQFRPELFKGRVASIVRLFFDTGVAYTFDLEMTEVNDLGTEINLLKPFTTSKVTLGIKGGFNRQRKNERVFTISDSFGGLVRVPDSYCNGRTVQQNYNFVVQENYIYPIVGKIGVKRLVQDFINLTLFANLGGPKDHPGPAGPPTLVDNLEFTTTLTGTLTPQVIFSPVGTGLSVTDASLTGVASRTDLHKVTMGLAIAGPGLKLVGPVRTSLFTTSLLSARPTSPAEINAAEAVNQFLTLKLFRPNITVVP